MGSRQFPGQADLAALLWWHWGLPGLYLPFHARPRSGVKRTEGSKERPARQQLVSFTPAHSAYYNPHPSDAGDQAWVRSGLTRPHPSSGS